MPPGTNEELVDIFFHFVKVHLKDYFRDRVARLAGDFAGDFFALVVFLAGDFLAAFLAGDFLAAAFLAGDFLTGDALALEKENK